MLQSLHIVNFAIIEDTVIDLTKGVTIFTGETGAGKSILIDALAVLTGRRAKTDLIRTGADFFKVEGIFYADDSIVSALQELGIECEGHEVIRSARCWCVCMNRMTIWSSYPSLSAKRWWIRGHRRW